MSELNLSNSSNQTLLESLNRNLHYAMKNSPFYKKHFAGMLDDKGVRSIEEFTRLPFTTKADISKNNRDFLAVPICSVAEYVTTSGTTGEPVTIFLTESDLERLALNEEVSFKLTGVGSNDVFQLMTTIDKQFMAGLAYQLGVRKLNAGLIRIGPGSPAMQWKSILQNKPTVLIAVPSFIISLIDYAIEHQIDYKDTSVQKIVCIGESVREENFSLNTIGKRICQQWDVQLFSTYASTEMATAFTECAAHAGCHLNPDLIHIEVIKENGSYAKEGETGEIVATPLNVKGTPLIRYRTGDLAKFYEKPCKCGRTSPRLGPIIGRKNQMIKYKGTTLFPKSIFDVLDQIEAVKMYKVEICKDELNNDQITVYLDDNLKDTKVIYDLVQQCRAKLRVVPSFEFVDTENLRQKIYRPNLRKPQKILFKEMY